MQNAKQQDAPRAAPSDLRDYVIEMGEQLGQLSLKAGAPEASALFALATAEVRRVKSG